LDAGVTSALSAPSPPPHQQSRGARASPSHKRADYHRVHDLPVDQSLDEHEPRESTLLIWLDEEGYDRGEPVDEQKDGVEREHLLEIGQRVGRAMLHLPEPDTEQTPQEEQIGQRRERGE